MLFKSVLIGFATANLVAGHGAIIKAVGDQGGNGTALGGESISFPTITSTMLTQTVDASTPRDGSTRNPFQQDSTRFKNEAADACGETLGGGTNDPATQVPQMLAANGGQMPQISAGGMVMMTLHQVNGDGAGPYECMIDSTGAGTQWTAMQVATNVPGEDSRSKAKATDFVSIALFQTLTHLLIKTSLLVLKLRLIRPVPVRWEARPVFAWYAVITLPVSFIQLLQSFSH